MILYNRKKVKYRKDGYCWKKRKDGKTTREDHMKLKVQGVEVRGCDGKTSQWSCLVKSMVSLPSVFLTDSTRRHIGVTQMNAETHVKSTSRCVTWERVVPLFLYLPPCSFPLSPFLSLSPSLSFWRIRVCLARGQEWCQCLLQQNREGYRSSLKAASVHECVRNCVRVCEFESHQPAKKLIIQQEYTKRWVEWACMCQKQKEWGRGESEGETARRHMDVCRGLNSFALKVSRRQAKDTQR